MGALYHEFTDRSVCNKDVVLEKMIFYQQPIVFPRIIFYFGGPYSSTYLQYMSTGVNRRKFIKTGGSVLLLLPFAQYCKSKTKTSSSPDKTKEKQVVRHISKKHKPPVTAAMVANRGWYKNKKNGKIHLFDNRGFTPSLEYLKDKKQFYAFIQHLEPWDSKQITLEIYQKNISKKKKDWITENAALAFIAASNFAGAGTIIKERIEKRPVNLRLWDLMAILSIRSNVEQ